MKKTIFTLLFIAVCHAMWAQNGLNPTTVFTIDSPAGIAGDFVNGCCCGNFYGTAIYSGDTPEELSGQFEWVRSMEGDSFGCSVIVNDIAGKFAVIRRGGGCYTNEKVFNAQKAGAAAAIILNQLEDDTCTIYLFIPPEGDSISKFITIPVLNFSWQTSEYITPLMDAGIPVHGTFRPRSIRGGQGLYGFGTPRNNTLPFDQLKVSFHNRIKDSLTNMTVKAEIVDASGNLTGSSSTTVEKIPALTDSIISLPEIPAPADTGSYQLVFSNSFFNQAKIDTARISFEITEHTFKMENIQEGSQDGFNYNSYVPYDIDTIHIAVPYQTVVGGEAAFASFSLYNPEQIFGLPLVPNEFALILYDADANNDGIDDLQTGFTDLTPIGAGTYQGTGEEGQNAPIYVGIHPVGSNTGTVPLAPGHRYYLGIMYLNYVDDMYNSLFLGGSFSFDFFSPFSPETSMSFQINAPTANFFGNDSYIRPALRLYLEGFNPPVAVQDRQMPFINAEVFPNPASDVVRLKMQLETPETVTISLFSFPGKIHRTWTEKNFPGGTLTLDSSGLPAGTYGLWVRTSKGAAVLKVVVVRP